MEEADLVRCVFVACEQFRDELVGVGRDVSRQGVVGAHGDDEVVPRRAQHLAGREDVQHAPEELAVLGQNAQTFPQRVRFDHFGGRPLPAELVQGIERKSPRQQRQVGEQARAFPRIDVLGTEVLGEARPVTGHRLWFRQEIGRQDAHGRAALPPNHLVEQFVDSLDCGEERSARRPLDRVSVEFADEKAFGVVDPEVAAGHFRHAAAAVRFASGSRSLGNPNAFRNPNVAENPLGQSRRKLHPVPGEGQIGCLVVAARTGIAGSPHRLETAIEKQRMDVHLGGVHAGRQRDLGERFARARPQRLERTERRPEIDAERRLAAVVGRHVVHRQPGLQGLDVHRLRGGGKHRRGRRKPRLGVQGPVRFRRMLAQDLDPAPRALGDVHQDLHLAALVGGVGIVGVSFSQHERVLELEILDQHGLLTGLRGHGGRHGTVERARRDEAAEDAVVAEPRRLGGMNLGVEGRLAPGGVVPIAEQGVVGGDPASPSRRPEAFALERIAR